LSAEFGRDDVKVGSVEKVLGLKSNGDGDRKKPLAGNEGDVCDVCDFGLASPLLAA
jgi:hypothetical protein